MLAHEKFAPLTGEADPRVRRTLTPVRVVTTVGDVKNAGTLTEKQPVQVTLGTPGGCFLTNTAEGTRAGVLVDFGMELHGSVNISVFECSGGTGGTVDVRLRTGESVAEALSPIGEKNTTNDHATRDFVLPVALYSSNESPETGFRFAYIELVTPGATLRLRSLTATLIIRELDYIGSFDCSDPLLTKCYDTAAYTAHLNMQRYLWDGVKRDRLVWAGDMNTEVNTILAVFGSRQCDVVQRSLDLMRAVTPAGHAMNTIPAYTMWWLLCHYDWYMATGDRDYLMEQRDYIREMIPQYLSFVREDGVETMGGFFDWPSNTHEEEMHAGRQGLLACALRGGAALLSEMGETELAKECLAAVEILRRHCPDARGYKQAAAMLAISGVSDAKKTADEILLPGGGKGLSTFLGYFTLSALGEAGYVTEALDIIRQYWGGMLSLGATTFWEDFDLAWMENAHRIDEMPVAGKKDPHGDYGAFCYQNFRHSLCHGWASGPAPFLTKYVLGVNPADPGMKNIRFTPHLGDLTWARGTVPTPDGKITVTLEKKHNGDIEKKIVRE